MTTFDVILVTDTATSPTYLRAHELATELNTQVWTTRGPKKDNVDYKLGTVADPINNYFIPLIEMLKNG